MAKKSHVARRSTAHTSRSIHLHEVQASCELTLVRTTEGELAVCGGAVSSRGLERDTDLLLFDRALCECVVEDRRDCAPGGGSTLRQVGRPKPSGQHSLNSQSRSGAFRLTHPRMPSNPSKPLATSAAPMLWLWMVSPPIATVSVYSSPRKSPEPYSTNCQKMRNSDISTKDF